MEATVSKRDNILSASLVLFSERGFDATTVPMIADRAGVGAGTIYRYFDNKEALVNALFCECLERFLAAIRRDYPEESDDARRQFGHIFRGMAQYARESSDGLHFINAGIGARYLDERSRRLFDDMFQFFDAFIERGQRQGVIRQLPAVVLSAMVFGAYNRIHSALATGVIAETAELLEGIEASLWDAVRTHPA